MLCRPGTRRPFSSVALLGIPDGRRLFVHRFIAALTSALPHTRTNTTRSRYGSHPEKTSAAECGRAATTTGLSPSSRMIVRGVQSFSTRTMTTMHVNEAAISVSSGPM